MNKNIPSINGLRAISILTVVFAHCLLENFHISGGILIGQLGVNVFFVISGYLITYLLIAEENLNRTISLKNFYIRRTIRIFPIYYFLLLVYFILQLLGVLHFDKISWLTSLTYTKYFISKNILDKESGHLWSLSIEEHFYLIWPFIFKYQKKLRLWFALATIIIITLIRLYTNIFDLNILTRGDSLMIGCVTAMFNKEISDYIVNVKNKFLLLIPFFLLLMSIVLKAALHSKSISSEGSGGALRAFIGGYGLLANISIALILMVSINAKNSVWFSLLNSKIMNYIGKLSYSIYIWHVLFFSPKLGFYSEFPQNIIFIFIVANASYYLIEKPFLSLKDKFIKKKQPISIINSLS